MLLLSSCVQESEGNVNLLQNILRDGYLVAVFVSDRFSAISELSRLGDNIMPIFVGALDQFWRVRRIISVLPDIDHIINVDRRQFESFVPSFRQEYKKCDEAGSNPWPGIRQKIQNDGRCGTRFLFNVKFAKDFAKKCVALGKFLKQRVGTVVSGDAAAALPLHAAIESPPARLLATTYDKTKFVQLRRDLISVYREYEGKMSRTKEELRNMEHRLEHQGTNRQEIQAKIEREDRERFTALYNDLLNSQLKILGGT